MYKLRYSKRVKRMRIEVVPGEVRVIAPVNAKAAAINMFVNSKKGWIDKKQAEFEEKLPFFSGAEGEIVLFGELLSEKDVLNSDGKEVDDLDDWYDTELLAFLKNLLKKYPMLVPFRIRLGNAKTRWGSCNAKGIVMINRKLVHAPPMVIEYVLVHELAHLKHRNHSRLFWSEVKSHLGDFSEQKRWLRDYGVFL